MRKFMSDYYRRYEYWEQSSIKEVAEREGISEDSLDLISVTDNGTAYIGDGGAYPIIIKKAVTPWSENI